MKRNSHPAQFSHFKIKCCAFCGLGGEKSCLSYFKDQPNYFETRCCKALICYKCNFSRGKCMACLSETFGEMCRKNDWIRCFSDFDRWNTLCVSFPYMLPLLKTV